MKPADRGETDALVRRLRGYARVFFEPVHDPEDTRVRMNALMAEGFLELDRRLRAGEPLPEFWDGAMYHRPRERSASTRRNNSYDYTYPPGLPGPAGCSLSGRACDWIDPKATETACRRCHTIRMRVLNAIQGQE